MIVHGGAWMESPQLTFRLREIGLSRPGHDAIRLDTDLFTGCEFWQLSAQAPENLDSVLVLGKGTLP